jgi:N-ethylmaleimide reductase
LAAEYYSQRASAGLIFSEGTQVSLQGIGYINTPGIYTAAQVAAWKKVTDAVHKNGGLIFCQLWHTGRVSHPDFHNGELPVAPSAVGFEGKAFTKNGFQDVVTPRALKLDEIEAIIEDHRRAALLAKEAGFDGVEIHGANSYLPAQFLEDGSNKRTDAYGGSIENRARFLLAITDAAIGVWGAKRVSVRLSPRNPFNGMSDSTPEKTYLYVVTELAKRSVGLLHVVEPVELPKGVSPLAPEIRKAFSGILILNGGYTQAIAEEAVRGGKADAISFGSLFLANPDLPERFERDAPLHDPDQATFYGGAAKGYVDYTRLGDTAPIQATK